MFKKQRSWHNQSHHIWQTDGETVADFIFLGSKVTADDDDSHEIKRFAPWNKSYDQQRQNIKEQRQYFANKFHIVKAMVFPLVMYRCESWTIKKAEGWRIDVFQLWCWRRLLRVHWTSKGSNLSILKEINSEYSLEGLMLNLKLQYFGHIMRRADSLGKTLIWGKIESKRRRGRQKMRWLYSISNSMDTIWTNSRRQKRTDKPGMLLSRGHKESYTT